MYVITIYFKEDFSMRKEYESPRVGVITARIDRDINVDSAYSEIMTKCSTSTVGVFESDFLTKMMVKDPSFRSMTATANWDPRDEYNECTGKRVASIKLNKKYHLKVVRQYKRYIAVLDKAVMELSKLMMKHLEEIQEIDQALEKLNSGEE